MTVQDILQQLTNSEAATHHLVIANLFNMVFGRRVRTTEWGHLRKLINMYGAETVYWAMLNSSHIDATGKPLIYVSRVCTGMVKDQSNDMKQLADLRARTVDTIRELMQDATD